MTLRQKQVLDRESRVCFNGDMSAAILEILTADLDTTIAVWHRLHHAAHTLRLRIVGR